MGLVSTTVRLDDALLERVKAVAAHEHRSVTQTLVMLLEAHVREVEQSATFKAQLRKTARRTQKAMAE